MKKSLLAVAAMTAFAGAAQAQSSVTVYGILDMGYIGGNQTGSVRNTQKATYNSFGESAESTSRLGFKGTEDMGGGTKAFFTVEYQLTPQGVNVLGANRQTFIGMSKNGLGQFAVGTQYTPIHTAIGQTSAGQQNNMVGDVIYPIPTNNNGNRGTGVGTNDAQGLTSAYTIRTANTLSVQSENMKGFVGKAFYTLNNSNTTETGGYNVPGGSTNGGSTNDSGWGIGLNYTWQKLLVTANFQSLKSTDPYGTTTSAAGVPTYTPANAEWSGSAGGTNVKDNQYYIAATYDFGILKAYAQFINRKATATQDANYFLNRNAQQIGVRGNITPTIDAWASVGNGSIDSFGPNTPKVNFTGFQLGSNYYLSKRTNLYAIFGRTGTSSSTLPNGNSSQPSLSSQNYAVGVRHSF
jgi:predicted porin